jgi:hypothetical protein
MYFFNCFFISFITEGCLWPRGFEEIPAIKSRYFLFDLSQIYEPFAFFISKPIGSGVVFA